MFSVLIRIVLLVLPTALWAQSSLLQITSPRSGTVAHSGQTIQITLAVFGSFRQIGVIGEDPLPWVLVPSGSTQVSLQIPSNIAAGAYQLTAVGVVSPGHPDYSEPVLLDIEPAADIKSVKVEPTAFYFDEFGVPLPFRVLATFADGTSGDVTRSSFLSYRSDTPSVATVDKNGIVTAVAPGSSRIIVLNRLVPVAFIPVTVR